MMKGPADLTVALQWVSTVLALLGCLCMPQVAGAGVGAGAGFAGAALRDTDLTSCRRRSGA